MSLAKYDKYKDSGIEMLGEIPDHWTVNRLKALGDIRYGLGQPPNQLENGLPIIRATNVSRGKITTKDMLFVDPNDLPYDRKPILKTDEIIVVRSGAYTGDSAIIPKEYSGSVTGYDMVFTPKYINPMFVAFTILSNYVFQDQLVISSLRAAQPHLNKEELGNTMVSLPPLPEQTAIATYLDQKTSAIDRKVVLLEQKIAHYQQLRKSLINETVCRGLDKNVNLKESGIEWIGRIPVHWEVKRFKSFAQTIKGKNLDFSDVYFEKSLPNLSLEYLRNDEVVFQTFCYSPSKSLIVNEDDYIIVWDGAGVGEILNGKKGYLSSTIAKIVVNKKMMTPKYFFHLRDKIEYTIKQIPAGMGIPHLNPFVLNNFPSPHPPLNEQIAIAQYLDEKTQKIDSIVANVKGQIATLKELRKTLINDVVTGKIRV